MRPAFRTIAEAVAKIGELFPQHGYVFQNLEGLETSYSYPEVERETAKRAGVLQEYGLTKGDRLGLIVIEPEDFVLTFLAAVRVGIVPVPLYPPMSFGNLDAYAERTAKVLESAGARLVCASARLQNVLWGLVDRVPTLERLVVVETLKDATATPTFPQVDPEDLAFLQYTSGSTADPKGVMVTHGSLIANSKGIILEGLQLDPDKGDKGISWLPLYHDMGLIGFVIAPMVYGVPVVFIPTMRFIKRPSVWLETIHRHRGTASFAPNFAYALATRRIKESDLERWDLSCLKVLGCGAEPIQPETMRAFTELFSTRCKLPTTSIMPAYGMAEATLAITLKPAPETFQTLVIDADSFAEQGRVVAPLEGKGTSEFVSCGVAFEGHEVAILDELGNSRGDGVEGEICHRGPSVTLGYYGNPEATAQGFRQGWLRTGDLGFTRDGQVYVTGRIKDLIIVNGRNVHPQAVEWAVADVDGVRRGNVVAFSVPGELGEELVVVVETKTQDPQKLSDEVRMMVQRELSLSTRQIVCLLPGNLPKTSSGKLQRRKTREQYLKGDLGGSGPRTLERTTRPPSSAGTARTASRWPATSPVRCGRGPRPRSGDDADRCGLRPPLGNLSTRGPTSSTLESCDKHPGFSGGFQMTNDEILQLIQQALGAVAPSRKADFANISADTKIEALGLDSIATMEMVNFIEEKVEVTFPDEELAKVQKVGDLAGLIRGGRIFGVTPHEGP